MSWEPAYVHLDHHCPILFSFPHCNLHSCVQPIDFSVQRLKVMPRDEAVHTRWLLAQATPGQGLVGREGPQ